MSFGKWSLPLLAVFLLAGCGELQIDLSQSQTVASEPTTSSRKKSMPVLPAPPTAKGDPKAKAKMPFIKGYERGLQQATATGKPMLVFFTAEWCQHCHRMSDDAFTNPQVVDLADRFVCILVDADNEPEVCKQFRIQAYPTVQFVSFRGVPLNRLVGGKPTDQVTTAMHAALQNVARTPTETKTKQR